MSERYTTDTVIEAGDIVHLPDYAVSAPCVLIAYTDSRLAEKRCAHFAVLTPRSDNKYEHFTGRSWQGKHDNSDLLRLAHATEDGKRIVAYPQVVARGGEAERELVRRLRALDAALVIGSNGAMYARSPKDVPHYCSQWSPKKQRDGRADLIRRYWAGEFGEPVVNRETGRPHNVVTSA